MYQFVEEQIDLFLHTQHLACFYFLYFIVTYSPPLVVGNLFRVLLAYFGQLTGTAMSGL